VAAALVAVLLASRSGDHHGVLMAAPAAMFSALYRICLGVALPEGTAVHITCPYAGNKCGKPATLLYRTFANRISYFDVYRLKMSDSNEEMLMTRNSFKVMSERAP